MSTTIPVVVEVGAQAAAPLEPEPAIPAELYECRQYAMRRRMREAGIEVLAIYADREHFANSSYLTGFDPRFEEALILLADDAVTILAGNESLSLVAELPGAPVGVLCQAFSLPGQDRSICPTIPGALAQTTLKRSARVGVVGWKPVAEGGVAIPHFVLTGLERHFGSGWQDVTAWFGGIEGARTRAGADQLALHEHRATRASRHVWAGLRSLAPGVSELQVSQAMGLTGLPHACHVMCTSGAETANGLRSPTDRILGPGDRISMAVGLWGGLASRAGRLVAHDEPGLEAWVERVAGPYMGAQRLWYESLRLGANAGEIAEAVHACLAEHGLRALLNPGHFVHLDEWVNSPFQAGSTIALRSGTALQCDIIPVTGDPGDVLNCEDGLALADSDLRAELAERFPQMWARILARRSFMADALGIELAAEVLPFGERPAALPAGLLSPDHIVRPRP